MITPARQAIIDQTHWVLANGSGWRYEEVRPVPLTNIKAGRLPVYTDCSGSVIGIAARAGVPDPSGYKFSGYGNTDSFQAQCEHIDYRTCIAGDLVNVASHASGTVHVYLVMEHMDNGDLSVFSHGGPDGVPPKTELLSGVQAYWYGRGYYFQGLRWLPVAVKLPPRWQVTDGHGKSLGHTNHPKLWVARKPGKIFRNNTQVRFIDTR